MIGNAVGVAAPPPRQPCPPDYIDPEHQGDDRELLQLFYGACNAEGGTVDEITLRGLRAVLAARPAAPAAPETALAAKLISESKPMAPEMAEALTPEARWGLYQSPAAPAAPEPPAEALAARPLLEQVAAMADCIGANTVGQITAISSRAAAWLRDNPPGQPVAIEPRGCPTPGACSCVEPAPVVQRDAVIAAVTEALGNAYDCQRVWEAWSVGTMGQDDFVLVAEDSDRVAEIADAAIEAMRPAAPAAPPAPEVVPVPVAERPWEREGFCGKWGYCWRFDPCENGWWSYGPPVGVMNDPGDWTHMASHDAIPLPQGEEGEG